MAAAAIPKVGFGTWKLARDTCAAAVLGAIRAGYRHLDCAADYGNEAEVGAGIRAAIAEGLVARGDLWVTSKLWNTCHAPQHVRPAFERTLGDLGLEYLDLYLVHFPIAMAFVPFEEKYPAESPRDAAGKVRFARVPMHATWGALEELHTAGLVRNLGVSNFNAQLLVDLLSYARVPPLVNQVEMHPYLNQARLLAFCQAHGIAVTAYSPFGGSSYVELGLRTTTSAAATYILFLF
jgi:D-xylose reductase